MFRDAFRNAEAVGMLLLIGSGALGEADYFRSALVSGNGEKRHAVMAITWR